VTVADLEGNECCVLRSEARGLPPGLAEGPEAAPSARSTDSDSQGIRQTGPVELALKPGAAPVLVAQFSD